MDCILCKIANGDLPSKKVFENERILAIVDIAPMAKTHIIIFPKSHIDSCDDINNGNSGIIADIFVEIPKIAASVGLTKGYRIINNCGEYGGQSIPHLHFHLLGGEQLSLKIN